MTWRDMGKPILGILLHEHIWSKIIWEWSERCDHEVPKTEFHWAGHVGRCTSELLLLSSVIWETGNNHSEDCHNNRKIKLSSNLGLYGEEGQDQKQNGSTLLPVLWKKYVTWPIRIKNDCVCTMDIFQCQ